MLADEAIQTTTIPPTVPKAEYIAISQQEIVPNNNIPEIRALFLM
jgi:hypothetical protein